MTTICLSGSLSREVLGALLVVAAAAPVAGQEVSAERLDRPRMEEILLHGEVGRPQQLSVGVSGSSRAAVTWQTTSHDAHIQTIDTYLGSGSRIVNHSDSYRYNVAAYRLDRMLGLDMVPVSVKRTIGGKPAALTWWVDDVVMMELERKKLGRRPSNTREWNEQMYRASIFQELASNSDCNQTNLLITRDWRIWMVDFTRAFRVYHKLARPQHLARLDPRLRDALELLDETSLRVEMKGLLNRSQIRGILVRRDLILAHFDARSAPTGRPLPAPIGTPRRPPA